MKTSSKVRFADPTVEEKHENVSHSMKKKRKSFQIYLLNFQESKDEDNSTNKAYEATSNGSDNRQSRDDNDDNGDNQNYVEKKP